jgi:hypothetical protein
MAKTFTQFDLELLGYTNIKEFGPQDYAFRMFEGTVTAGVQSLQHRFLYLKDDGVSETAVDEALQASKGTKDWHIIHPDARVPGEAALRKLRKVGRVFSHTELIWSRLQVLFAEYLHSLHERIPAEEWFIQPRYSKPGHDPHDKLDEDLAGFLTATGKTRTPPGGTLLVIKAPAGVGKTTLAREVVRGVAAGAKDHKVIPVYVEASHWGKLQLPSVSELWDIIRNSLMEFSSSLALREELFDYALKQGWICFVFDGFDELCANKLSNFKANDVLAELATLAQQSEARVVVTTRSLFWSGEVTVTPPNVAIWELAPFIRAQAMRYFEFRFSKQKPKLKAAQEIYGELTPHVGSPVTPGGSRAQLINTPICVSMIAELAEQGRTSLSSSDSKPVLQDILIKLCERDRRRQSFVTPPETQLHVFEELSISKYDEFGNEELEILGFDAEDIRSGRTVDHVLITSGSAGAYRMRYEFLPPYFKAHHLLGVLADGHAVLNAQSRVLIADEANGRGYVLEHLVQLLPFPCFSFIKEKAPHLVRAGREMRLFLFHLLRLALDSEQPKDTAGERSSQLFSIAFGAELQDGKREIRGLIVSGSIERLDLRNVAFLECSFRDVSFVNCVVDDTTTFVKCDFRGDFSVADQQKAWRKVRLVDPRAEPPASLAIQSTIGSKSLDRDSIARDAIRLAIEKFWHHGQLRRSLKIEDFNRGLIAKTQMASLLLEVLRRSQVIEDIETSGVKDSVGVPVESIPAIKQFMDNNQMTGRIKIAYEDLLRNLG